MPENKDALDGYVLAHFGELVTTLGRLEVALEHARDFLQRTAADPEPVARHYAVLATACDESRLTVVKAIRTLDQGAKCFARSVETR